MKKILALAVVAVLLIAATLLYRAESVFENKQLPPADLGEAIAIDASAVTARFSQALSLKTISHDDRSRFDAKSFLQFHSFLQDSFPLVHQRMERKIINGYSLLYHLPGSDPALKPVLFMGHMDVVPVDDITHDEWTHPPFEGTVANGSVWGRGALDDKYSVMGLMEAMELFLAEHPQPERSIYLAFGHDEEVGGADGAAATAQFLRSQAVELEFVLDEGGFVAHDFVSGITRPVAFIGIAEKGFVNLELVVNAPGGHSSQPPDHTAVGILSEAIVAVENNQFPATLDYSFITMDVLGVHSPLLTRVRFANTWLLGPLLKYQLLKNPGRAADLRTTAAATMISGSSKSNILPTRASAIVNLRIIPGETTETVKAHIKRAIDDKRVEISISQGQDPSAVSSTDSPAYQLIARTIRGLDDDIIVVPYVVRGGTDAKWFTGLSPNVYRFMMSRGTPETIKQVHGIDEHMQVADYLEGIRFFYHMLEKSGRAGF